MPSSVVDSAPISQKMELLAEVGPDVTPLKKGRDAGSGVTVLYFRRSLPLLFHPSTLKVAEWDLETQLLLLLSLVHILLP